jgi:cysteine-rich repeat protein
MWRPTLRALAWTALLSLACCQAEPVGGNGHAVVVEINADFDFVDCPLIAGIGVSPLEVELGSEVVLQVDVRDGVSEAAWSSSSGLSTFGDAGALETTYRCAEPGKHKLTLVLWSERGCKDEAVIGVACGRSSTCGDGMHAHGEQCDDGNQTPGDGCSELCGLEVD